MQAIKQPIGSFANPYKANDFVNAEQKALHEICLATNDCARDYCDGDLDSCILSSYALVDVLKTKGYDAFPLRVETGVFPSSRRHIGTILGPRSREGRTAAGKGMWAGHLVVGVGHKWLLDPTLDQANKDEWDGLEVEPVTVALSTGFWTGETVFLNFEKILVRYTMHHRQNSFKGASDARPSHWRPLAEMILDRGFHG
jgi:hypothetical protein